MPELFDHLPPGATPSFDDLVDAVRDLNEARQNITVADLPMRQLQDKLETDWNPSTGLLLPNAVTKLGTDPLRFGEVLSAGYTMPAGVSTLAISGGGLTTVTGVIVLAVSPASHWSFEWFPRATDVVLNNAAGSQSFSMTYMAVGR